MKEQNFAIMPTFVWRIRPTGVTSAKKESATAAALPDPVVSASAAVPDSHLAVSASSTQFADDGKGDAATAAKKKAKLTSTRDLPPGVRKTRNGTFASITKMGGKSRYIGTFKTPEQASAAYLSAKKDLEDGKLSALGADEVDTAFDAAKKKAQESCGGFVSEKRDLPRGVREISPGKFISVIWWYGKDRYIGTFDTPELASAAYVSVKKDMKNAKLSTLSANEVNALFDAAQKKAVEAVGVLV